RAGGYAGDFLARELSEYLNRTGSLIVVVTLIALSVILSTQFSFGRMMAAIVAAVNESVGTTVAAIREWRETRRREKERADVIATRARKAAPEVAGRPAKKADAKQDEDDEEQERVPAVAAVGLAPRTLVPPKPPR